jgi:hypothetical protein
MLTNLKLFFWSPDANFFYGHKIFKIPRSFSKTQKWTFINVQKRFSDFTFGKKNHIFYIYY